MSPSNFYKCTKQKRPVNSSFSNVKSDSNSKQQVIINAHHWQMVLKQLIHT